MPPTDRKRDRGEDSTEQNDGATSSSTASLAKASGPLQPRTVNTVEGSHDGDGAGAKLRQPPLKKKFAGGPPRQPGSGAASERSSASSQLHTAHAARGKPQQPFRANQLTAATGSASVSLIPRVRAALHTAATRSKHGVPQVRTSHSPRSSASEAETLLKATWKAKREGLEEEVRLMELQSRQLADETEAVEDAIEAMLTDFEADKQRVEAYHANTVSRYQALMTALRAREDVCLAAKQRALNAIDTSVQTVQQLCAQQEQTQEAIILSTEQREALEARLSRLATTEADHLAFLQQLQIEEERMKDASYGLSGEVRELVLEMEGLKTKKKATEVASMEAEVARRELYSLCEELKGSIRVYCRVKGSAVLAEVPASPAAAPAAVRTAAGKDEKEAGTCADGVPALSSPAKAARGGSVESSISTGVRSTSGVATAPGSRPAQLTSGGVRSGRSTTRSSVTATTAMVADEAAAAQDDDDDGNGDGERSLFSFPDRVAVKEVDLVDETASDTTGLLAADEAPPCSSILEIPEAAIDSADAVVPLSSGRAVTIHQTRSNATSTGMSNTEESFIYDRVFTGSAQQGEIYRDVEPLVRNAVDGYRVCVFAYGQTGSGKTFTMEGDLRHTPEAYGVTPRALRTILQRQAELAKEGWSYELSCTFIEIYNDVIRDLFQSGSSRYETAMQQSGNAATYHTIKHSGDRTQITNVSEKAIHSMEEFFALYTRAVDQRSTAKTELNDKSSRSHCIFTLSITGTNATIRQRSEGVLCLVDLAGSERVNESGVQGKQFKEAVNINRSLLDLGKCIRALRCGAVVPWRNCKLTYLLQNYLGAKGGKMLMIVTVSNLRQHAPESINSLRFASRVQETFVGTSVKRVVNMM